MKEVATDTKYEVQATVIETEEKSKKAHEDMKEKVNQLLSSVVKLEKMQNGNYRSVLQKLAPLVEGMKVKNRKEQKNGEIFLKSSNLFLFLDFSSWGRRDWQ